MFDLTSLRVYSARQGPHAVVFLGDFTPETRFLFFTPHVQSGISESPSAVPNGVIEYSTFGGSSL